MNQKTNLKELLLSITGGEFPKKDQFILDFFSHDQQGRNSWRTVNYIDFGTYDINGTIYSSGSYFAECIRKMEEVMDFGKHVRKIVIEGNRLTLHYYVPKHYDDYLFYINEPF